MKTLILTSAAAITLAMTGTSSVADHNHHDGRDRVAFGNYYGYGNTYNTGFTPGVTPLNSGWRVGNFPTNQYQVNSFGSGYYGVSRRNFGGTSHYNPSYLNWSPNYHYQAVPVGGFGHSGRICPAVGLQRIYRPYGVGY